MKTMKDGRLALDEGLGSKRMFNHPHFAEERVTPEIRNLDALRGRRSPILVRLMKFNQFIYFKKNLLPLLH